MTEHGIHNRVRTWLMTGPGAYFASSPGEVLRMAHASAGGLQMSITDFSDCLKAEAYQPSQLGRRWVLALPAGPNK